MFFLTRWRIFNLFPHFLLDCFPLAILMVFAHLKSFNNFNYKLWNFKFLKIIFFNLLLVAVINFAFARETEASQLPEKKEKKKNVNFLFMLQAFIDFFHHVYIFMHIILNEMSQEKYLPFAHKFFPSSSVQIPDVVNIARLFLSHLLF